MPSYNNAEKKYRKGTCEKKKPLNQNKLRAAMEERRKQELVKTEKGLASEEFDQ